MAASDAEEDDYMSMTFTDHVPSSKETSMQRRTRKEREARERGRPKSKKEIEEAADLARETGLHTAIDSTNKGFKMMAKLGYKPGTTLGKSEDARMDPIQLDVKDGRGGIGMESEKKRKVREAFEEAQAAVKKVKEDEDDFRVRLRLEREEARQRGQVVAAQKVLEKFDTEPDAQSLDGSDDANAPGNGATTSAPSTIASSKTPIKKINVLWRGLMRQRLEHEREERLRHELKQFNSESVRSTSDGDKEQYSSVVLDDLDEEDPELEEFEGLPVDEQLEKLVMYLRKRYGYCFWCKHRYGPDMDGCPGTTEEDHD